MNERDLQEIKKFINDPVMSGAVYQLLYRFFLKKRKTEDVQMLATERLALFLFEDAWKEVERMGRQEQTEKSPANPGL